MKIYVAGKTHQFRQVRMVQRLCESNGHTITYDWTKNVEEVGGPAHEAGVPLERQAEYALADARGVRNSNLVIAFPDDPRISGTLVEIGMAIAWELPVWLLGMPSRWSVFFALPNFTQYRGPGDPDFLKALGKERALIRSLDPMVVVPPADA